MLVDLARREFAPADAPSWQHFAWDELAHLWNDNELDAAHDWLNERWSRLIRNSVLGSRDPEAEFLQGLAFATLAFFFTQNQNQEGAVLLIDDAVMALAKFQPRYLGVQVAPIVDALQELRPVLAGLAPDADCPLFPFVLPRFEVERGTP